MKNPIKKWQNWPTATLVTLAVALFLVLVGLLFCNTLTLEVRVDGDEQVVLEYGDSFADPGAYAVVRSNVFSGFCMEIPLTMTSWTEKAQLGDNTVLYHADFLWLHSYGTRTIRYVDTARPVISLVDNPDSFTLPGQAYVEEGFTATDNFDGDITHLVERVVTDTQIIYKVSDSSGNTTQVYRTIRYDDPVPPVLTLTGDAQITITAGTAYKEPGYSASDNCDGDLTASVTVEGRVNISVPGNYTLTYVVTDAYGNSTSVTRTVVVEASTVVTPTDKVIYLTFDDGPSKYTKRLLEILKTYGVKATFFVTNQQPAYAHLLTNIAQDGHAIGIHSYTHIYKDIYSSKERFFEDFNKIRQLIYDKTGQWSNIMRFPGGSGGRVSTNYCPGIITDIVKDLNEMGYLYYDWNVVSGDDGTYKDADSIANAVISAIKTKSVSCVLQHDLTSYSVEATVQIIEWGLANGYTFLTLDATSPVFHQNIRN